MTEPEYIDIREVGGEPVGGEEYRRTSALLDLVSTERGLEGLQVIGNLPHAYTFEPKTVRDAERLRAWLASWIERHPNGPAPHA